MWTISELKDRARAAFKANYWTCVGVALIAALVSGGGSCRFNQNFGTGPSSAEVREVNNGTVEFPQDAEAEEVAPAVIDADSDFAPAEDADADVSAEAAPDDSPAPQTLWAFLRQFRFGDDDSPLSYFWIVVAVVVVSVCLVIGLLLRFLLLNPLSAGCCNFFLRNATAKADFSAIGAGFHDWKRFVKTLFLRDLFLFLWCLPGLLVCLVIPVFVGIMLAVSGPDEAFDFAERFSRLNGIPLMLCGLAFAASLLAIPFLVKTYSYRLVPYLLSDDPSLAGCGAIDRSRALMNGHKFHVFLLDLSFIGWYILGILTCGILLIFHVFPYVQCTNAELYRALAFPGVPPPLPPPEVPPAPPSGD